jgi:hypothetical protein
MSGLSNVLHQRSIDYPGVIRPLFTAAGGAGALQFLQIANNALSLDNAEARVTARINLSNYLRAAGREVGLDVRESTGGAEGIPSPMKPYVSAMYLSALANDGAGFQENFQKALEAARGMGKPDAVDAIKRSFAGMSPLRTIFATTPSQSEIKQMLAQMSARGQENVTTAMGFYNRYAETLGIPPSEGRADKSPLAKLSPARPVQSLADIRARSIARPVGSPF